MSKENGNVALLKKLHNNIINNQELWCYKTFDKVQKVESITKKLHVGL